MKLRHFPLSYMENSSGELNLPSNMAGFNFLAVVIYQSY